MLDIRIDIVENDFFHEDDICALQGRIKIGDYQETLYIPFQWWNKELYQQQWAHGLARLKNYDTSCLVVTIDNPEQRKFIEWWLLYKVDNKVYVRNSILIEDIYQKYIGEKSFTIDTCYDFIPDRDELQDEAGNKISEWVVDCH